MQFTRPLRRKSERFLFSRMRPLEQRTEQERLQRLGNGFRQWLRRGVAQSPNEFELLSVFLVELVANTLNEIGDLRREQAQFHQRILKAVSEEEVQDHILNCAATLGATRRQIRQDRAAFGRWLDHEAMAERIQRRCNELERLTSFYLSRLSDAAVEAITQCGNIEEVERVWTRLDLESLLKSFSAYRGDSRVRIQAFRTLASAIGALPETMCASCISDTTTQYIYRASVAFLHETWLQCAALELLDRISKEALARALRMRFGDPKQGDDLFVRRAAVRLLVANAGSIVDFQSLATRILSDPSPAVRQVLAEEIPGSDSEFSLQILECMLLEDESPPVRASALTALLKLSPVRLLASAPILLKSLEKEQDAFVLRVGITVCASGYASLSSPEQGEAAGEWYRQVVPAIEVLHRTCPAISIRRWAAQAREVLWSEHDAQAALWKKTLRGSLDSDRTRKSRVLRRVPASQRDLVGRVLAVLALEGTELSATFSPLGISLRKGVRFRPRAWRWWHEFWRPAPDKRQGFPHTIARDYRGRVQAPSPIMAEQSPTRTPGEPLVMSEEGGWRPYLPLPDQILSYLEQSLSSAPLSIYTSEGITRVRGARFLPLRLLAWVMLTLRFNHYARLRNWREGGSNSPQEYLLSLKRIGVRASFQPHANAARALEVDPAVLRFFPAVFPVSMPAIAERMQQYFVSVYENTLPQLFFFTAALCAFFFGYRFRQYQTLRRARHQIPLVLGGWGTRGKSSVERLKAGLLSALGYSVFSKTTGCEAMFLLGSSYGPLQELPIFRPYDKASIWEQRDMVLLAARLKVDAFLWECMALTPEYASTLQDRWMTDDISTITNTYPDHEDLQGPAGWNVTESLSAFIPAKSTLITTEEEMRPLLQGVADKKGSSLIGAGWLEEGLLTPDVMQRFPYEEHPRNVALVLKLAENLGVSQDYALKEMADRVVADVGMLRGYPPARVLGRELEFVNGMSANERFGCLSNWRRLGFDKQDPAVDPGVWITTVVNNRADRVARSKVFADIIVNDLSVDSHFLIGSNLSGMLGYIEASFEQYLGGLSLWHEEDSGPEDALKRFDDLVRQHRVPRDKAYVARQLARALEALDLDASMAAELLNKPEQLRTYADRFSEGVTEALEKHLRQWLRAADQVEAISRALMAGESHKKCRREVADLLKQWFQQKLHVFPDLHIPVDELIRSIAEATPPGFRNRIMGVQNIKGPGLHLVYRFQRWESVYRAGCAAQSPQRVELEAGLNELSAMSDCGLLSEHYLDTLLESLQKSTAMQSDRIQAQLGVIASNLASSRGAKRDEVGIGRGQRILMALLRPIEAFFDTGDAVRRRKRADKIYRDLLSERISVGRATTELRRLAEQQHGGWLYQRLRGALDAPNSQAQQGQPWR